MSTSNTFLQESKWVVIIAALTFVQFTKAYDPYLESKRIDFYLMRWYTASVENLQLTTEKAQNLIDNYGYENSSEENSIKTLFPTLDDSNGLYYLSGSALEYHLTILEKVTSLRKAAAGLAILQVKVLSTLHAINYINCTFYTSLYSIPRVRYCKEMALAMLDLSIMGTEVLCDKLTSLLAPADTMSIFDKFAIALKAFEKISRSRLEQIERTPENSSNAADELCKHAEEHSDNNWRDNGSNFLIQPMMALNEFIQKKKIDINIPPMGKLRSGPLQKIMELWLKVELVYMDSVDPSDDKLDLMKALFNSEINIVTHYKLFDEDTINNFKLTEQGDFELVENAPNNKIVIKPVY